MTTRSRMKRHPHSIRASRRLLMSVSFAAAVLGSAACGRSPGSVGTTNPKGPVTGSIIVSAAASLTGAFGQLGTRFQSTHPGSTITFNFGSSGTLAAQIQTGAPADVFASAATQNMETVQQSGDISGTPAIFARNRLEIVVKPGNPLGIHSLADLTKANVVAICVHSAPCGATAAEALRKSGVTLPTSKVTLGQDVNATLAEVTAGDANAAIVYVTNANTVGGQGVGISIPAAQNVTTGYPIAVVKATTNQALSRAWIAYVLGPIGQKVLQAAGFLAAH
jgi:molybdate transport system substrate-binding protein